MSSDPAPPPMTLGLGDCSRATGLSVKALRRRIERGTLASVLVDGRRRIPVAALVGSGLLVEGLDRGARGSGQGHVQPALVVQRLAAQRQRLTEELAVVADLEADVRRIAEQLRRERMRSQELEEQLAHARARLRQLER
jgi:hypothetical protein